MKAKALRLLALLRESLQGGESEEIAQAFVRYLEAQPLDALAWTDFAGILLGLQRYDEALKACRKALSLNPGQISAQYHLGCVSLHHGRLDEAEELFRKVLAVEPDRVEVRLSLAKCLLGKKDWEAARTVLEKVLQGNPANVSAHQYLGQIFYGQGQWAEFGAELQRYERQDPFSAYLEFERGFANLLQGVMPLGWQQWEARLRVPGCVAPQRDFVEPCWNGEPFADRTLLVHYEQGFGDTLMLVRFLPLVKGRGGRVLLLVQPSLAGLLTTCQGMDQVLAQGDPLPHFDLQISLYSLPRVFQTDLGSIPSEIPYVGIPPQVPNRRPIAEVLAASEGRTRIGLVWTGNSGHARDAERSLPMALLNCLEAVPDVAWHSFQIGQSDEPSLPGCVSLTPLLSDFSDTAYALSGMDLVISVDTALAHLAGAMGIPTLLLVTYVPDFRWLLDRDDSPWYPTLRIFRQPSPGDWDSVMNELVRGLTDGI